MEPRANRITKALIWMIAVLILIYVYYAGYLKPTAVEYITTKGALDMSLERLENLQYLESRVAVLKEDIDTKRDLLTEIDNMLPSSEGYTDIIVFLETAALDTGVNLREILFEDRPRSSKDNRYMAIPVRVRVSGAFTAMVKYLQAIEFWDRLLDVTDVSIMQEDWPYQGAIQARIGMCAFMVDDDIP
jgi:Tfp pilus assembly protein PilO